MSETHAQRKSEHLEICLREEVRSAVSTGLERYRLEHQALPEMALTDVDLSTQFLGRPLRAPLLVSSMTGGTPEAHALNLRLAAAAQAHGLAMGLGSQRVGIEDPALMETFRVRAVAPEIALYANLGAVQLVAQGRRAYGVDECRRAVDSVGADALILHLNPLQEALQSGGNTDFTGILRAIEALCRTLGVPVIVKEVGWGLSAAVARQLEGAGVAALDVAGAGGTSWSEVERRRAASGSEADVLAAPFASWGIPTVEALCAVRAACPRLPLVASGGIRDGVQAALCVGLGAELVGLAGALLGPADEGEQALTRSLQRILQQLRIAMFCSGARTLRELRGRVRPRGALDDPACAQGERP